MDNTSDIIQKYQERIMKRWLAQVKQEVPAAREHHDTVLRDDLLALLKDIVANIDSEQAYQSTHESVAHGRMRSTFLNYSLAHVIREYRILLRVILELVDQEGTVSIPDRDRIIFAVTWAIEVASEVFFQDRQKEDQEARQTAERLTEQLKDQEQLRDDFIGTVTHDLRNPLANISSLVELLEGRVGHDTASRKLLRAITTSYRRADVLIQNLLNATLIQSGQALPINVQSHDLRDIVAAAVGMFQDQAAVSIDTTNAQHSLKGAWDGDGVQRMVENLVSNAIKYGEGGVKVCYRMVDDETVSLQVHNNGNPIPTEEQDQVFSRYYRHPGQAQLGWGIGLSLVQGIAHAHGGSVTLRSSETTGTTFTVQLPRHTSVVDILHGA